MESNKNYNSTSHKIHKLWNSVLILAANIANINTGLARVNELIDKLWRRVNELGVRANVTQEEDGDEDKLCMIQAELINPRLVVTPLGEFQYHVIAQADLKVINIGSYDTANSFLILYQMSGGGRNFQTLFLNAGAYEIIERVIDVNSIVSTPDLSTEGVNLQIWIDPTCALTNASEESKLQHIKDIFFHFG